LSLFRRVWQASSSRKIGRDHRILYLQFADPAAYPSIEHSSALLAERGWDAVLLGTESFGDQQLKLPPHPRVRVKNLRLVKGRSRQKLQYMAFIVWSLCWICIWRPSWIYASDPLSAPVLWAARRLIGARVIYHEHDMPNRDWPHSRFMRAILKCRELVGRNADICVIPQQERLVSFIEQTQRSGPTICVWNCPRLNDIRDVSSYELQQLVVYYHGSINRFRLPSQLVVAASRFKGAIRLQIAGYETGGSHGYTRELMDLAAKNYTPDLIEFLGVLPFRKDLLRCAAKAHVGLSLMPKSSEDANLGYMVGASNKPFDYMACGLPLLVTDLPDWTSTFVEPGFARACDPEDADSIEASLRWYLDNPDSRRQMGRRCRDQIRQTWNYETVFAPVMRFIDTPCIAFAFGGCLW